VTKIVESRWDGAMRFTSTDQTGGVVAQDGTDGETGYRPSALLLASLAGCTGMDVISILAKKRQAVQDYRIVVTGDQRPTHPKTFTTIVVEHRFGGSDLDAEAVQRAIVLSATRYCPVTAQLATGDVAITHRFRMDGGTNGTDVVVTGPFGAGLDPVTDQPSSAVSVSSTVTNPSSPR
jgi:putative redox protein